MIEIAPGLRAGLKRQTARGAVYLAIEVSVGDHTNTVCIDETQIHDLLLVARNAAEAACAVRLGNQPKRMRWPARARE